jgi:hypothetical protein
MIDKFKNRIAHGVTDLGLMLRHLTNKEKMADRSVMKIKFIFKLTSFSGLNLYLLKGF